MNERQRELFRGAVELMKHNFGAKNAVDCVQTAMALIETGGECVRHYYRSDGTCFGCGRKQGESKCGSMHSWEDPDSENTFCKHCGCARKGGYPSKGESK